MNLHRGAWILSITLAVVCGCKPADEPAQFEDPLDDPWVAAIDTGAEQPAAAPASSTPAASANTLDPRVGTGAVASAQVPSSISGDDTPAAVASPTPTHPPAEAATPAGEELPSEERPAEERSAEELPAEELPVEPAPSIEPAPALSEPAAAPSPPPITRADFHGNYRFSGGQAEREGVTAGIETTVNALASMLRGIARKRLAAVNPVEGKVEIVVVGDKVTTTFESGFTATCVIDGATAHTKALDGSKLDVRVRAKGNKLVQQMEGKGGARVIVYVLSTDRKKLTVHTKITSKRLPVPLTYRMTYTRK